MKRVILIGMMVVFVAVASLPAVGVYAGFPGITGNNPTADIQTSSHKQYHPKKGKKGKKGKKKKGPKAGKGCAKVGGLKACKGKAKAGKGVVANP